MGLLTACSEDATSSDNASDTAPDAALSDQENQPETAAPLTPEIEATTTITSEIVAAECAADAILPVVAGLFPENDVWTIIDVDVANCQNGYARVFAIADQSTCDLGTPQCYEDEQVFLEKDGGSWEYIDSGTGISCGSPSDLEPEMIAVCDALELP